MSAAIWLMNAALFYEAVRVMEMVTDVAEERRVWVVKLMENVAR